MGRVYAYEEDEDFWDDDWGGKILWPQQQVDDHEETEWEDLE